MPKRFEDAVAKQTLNRVRHPRMPFDWSINPYRGCSHGCSFCYARGTHAFLGEAADDSFQTHIFVKANAAEALSEQLGRELRRCGGDRRALSARMGHVAIGTATDPYQPVEAKRRITRACLRVLADHGIETSITTRSPLILRDVDILRRMRLRSIHFSLHTVDARVWREFEPETPSPCRRLEAVSRLVAEGLPAGVFVAPILPYVSDGEEELAAVASAAAVADARFLMSSVLRLAPEMREWYMGVLVRRRPEAAERVNRLYRGPYPGVQYRRALRERTARAFGRSGWRAGGGDGWFTRAAAGAVGGPFTAGDAVESVEPARCGCREEARGVQLAFDW